MILDAMCTRTDIHIFLPHNFLWVTLTHIYFINVCYISTPHETKRVIFSDNVNNENVEIMLIRIPKFFLNSHVNCDVNTQVFKYLSHLKHGETLKFELLREHNIVCHQTTSYKPDWHTMYAKIPINILCCFDWKLNWMLCG